MKRQDRTRSEKESPPQAGSPPASPLEPKEGIGQDGSSFSIPGGSGECGAPARPVPATIGVVFREGRVLLVRRANPPDAGKWGFPGGKIEWGETIEAAAVREIAEETGVQTVARRVFTAVDCFDRRESNRLHQHYILLAVLCDWVSGEPLGADDALEARWFSAADIAREDLALSLNVPEVIRLGEQLSA